MPRYYEPKVLRENIPMGTDFQRQETDILKVSGTPDESKGNLNIDNSYGNAIERC